MENKETIEFLVKKETELYIAQLLKQPDHDMYLNNVKRIKTTGQKLLRDLIKVNKGFENLSDLYESIKLDIEIFHIECKICVNSNNYFQKYIEQQLSNLR